MTTSNEEKILEGVFFAFGQTLIEEDWCPFCKTWTKFGDPVNIKMDHVEKRKLVCGHVITYIFLVQYILGEGVEIIRKRFC